MPLKNKKTPRIPGKFDSIQDLDDIEDDEDGDGDGDSSALPPSAAGKRALALKPVPRSGLAGKLRSAAEVIGSLSNLAETGGGGGENWKSRDQGRLKMPVLFPKMTPPWNTNRQRPRDQAAPEIEPPSTPVRRNPASRDPPPELDLLAPVPRPGDNSRVDFNGLPVSSVFSFFDDAPASPPTISRRRQRLMLETTPSFSQNANERFQPFSSANPVDQAPASTPAPGSNLNRQSNNLRFRDEIDPDPAVPLRRNLDVPIPELPETSREEEEEEEERSVRNDARGVCDTAENETPDVNLQESITESYAIADTILTQAPTPTANDKPGPPPTTSIKSTRRYRFQDEIDPDLLALGPPTRKTKTWAALSASPLSVSLAPPIVVDFDSSNLVAWRRKRPNMQAELAATLTPVRKPKQSNIAGFPARLVNKRPRRRSSSPSSITPDTPPPPPKRQQQQYQQQSGTMAVTPRLPKDEIEDLDPSLGLVQRPEPSHKRPGSDVPSSPTKPVSPVRKRQRIMIDAEDIIEDGPESPPLPQRCRILGSAVPKRIDDASSSGDEVAEHTDDIDRTAAGFGALLLQPSQSQAPTGTAQSTGPRRLLGPDEMRLYFKTTKSIPGPPPALKPGMINILTHHKRIIVPRDPTPPPPASPPRIGYLEKGLAETAMWWKHDAQERHKRMFTDDKPALTSRVLVQEFLRDGKMCFIKGPGENKDGKEGDVRVVVTDRAAESVTMKGMALLYEGPWFQVRLLGEEEPYRFLIGNWRIE